MSQSPDNANLDIADTDQPESRVADPQDVRRTQIISPSNKPTPIWLFLAESAVQVAILALAIVGSMQTRRRALTSLVALVSVPQAILIANRLWRRIRSPPRVLSESVDPSTQKAEPLVAGSNSMEATQEQEQHGGELTTVQSKLVSTGIRSAVAEEVSSLRYAIEQVEQTIENRQQARNLAIAEAIASLDENLRGLRRSVDTRNQTEKSAPFALVSELEIVKSRLKQSEREKVELEIRLRAVEENFDEAKRQGERARREALEATSKEVGLRTELAIASSRLLRVEELTERLDTAERMNDELQERILNGTREQEGLRQSAQDAERRVVRVENIARLLRDKVQELTGRPLPKFGQDDGDGLDEGKKTADGQFWPQRLRGKGDLRPDSVVYQEMLREKKRSNSPLWPRDPLGIEQERQEAGQRKMLPDDGGFGTGESFTESSENDNGGSRMLSPEGGSDVMFSFSRGEFDMSNPNKTEAERLDESDASPQETRKSSIKEQYSQSEESTSDSVQSSEKPVSKDDTISTSLNVEEVVTGNSSVSTTEDDQIKPAPFSEGQQQQEEDYAQKEESKPREGTLSTEQLPNANILNDSALENDKVADKDQGGASPSDLKNSDLVRSQSPVKHDSENEASEQLEETSQEPEVSLNVTSVSNGNYENQQSVPLETRNSGGTHATPDQADVLQRTGSSIIETGQPSTVLISGETDLQLEQSRATTSYLESLSRNDEVKPVESTEDLILNARELVQKARVRGLAVKQADVLFTKATEKFERVILELDDRTDAEADLGGCLLAWAKTNIADPHARNRLLRALELLQSSCDSRPNDETVLFNTGLCLCLLASTSTEEEALEHYKMACDKYEKLIQVNYNSRIACFNCGLAYVSLGRLSIGKGVEVKRCFERAVVLFERSLELKPGDSKAISYLDDCRRQLAELDQTM